MLLGKGGGKVTGWDNREPCFALSNLLFICLIYSIGLGWLEGVTSRRASCVLMKGQNLCPWIYSLSGESPWRRRPSSPFSVFLPLQTKLSSPSSNFLSLPKSLPLLESLISQSFHSPTKKVFGKQVLNIQLLLEHFLYLLSPSLLLQLEVQITSSLKFLMIFIKVILILNFAQLELLLLFPWILF